MDAYCVYFIKKESSVIGTTFPEHAMVQHSSRQEGFGLASPFVLITAIKHATERTCHQITLYIRILRIRLDLNILAFLSSKVEITKDSCFLIHGL